MPGGPLNVDVLRQAVWTVAADMAAGGAAFPHIAALLARTPPRLAGRTAGSPVIAVEEREDRPGCSPRRSRRSACSIGPGS